MSVRALPVLFAFAGGCTLTSDEFQPSPVIAEAEANRPGMSAAAGQPPANSPAPVAPVLTPGEGGSPINNLLPPEMTGESSGGARTGAGGANAGVDIPVALADAGDDGGSDAGSPDAGASDAGDAAASDAGADTVSPVPPVPPVSPGGPVGSGDADAGPPDASAPAPNPPCPGLVFEGSCYEFFADQLSWQVAEARCVAWGGHLASVESFEEDAFLGAWPALVGIGFLDGSGLWLGGTDAEHDGDFRWQGDDGALSFLGWASDQPNNGQGVDCIEKRNDPSQRWYDRRCTDGERYVCERPE